MIKWFSILINLLPVEDMFDVFCTWLRSYAAKTDNEYDDAAVEFVIRCLRNLLNLGN